MNIVISILTIILLLLAIANSVLMMVSIVSSIISDISFRKDIKKHQRELAITEKMLKEYIEKNN